MLAKLRRETQDLCTHMSESTLQKPCHLIAYKGIKNTKKKPQRAKSVCARHEALAHSRRNIRAAECTLQAAKPAGMGRLSHPSRLCTLLLLLQC